MRRLALAALALALLAGCKIGVTVGIDAGDDGGGTVRAVVTLDRAAAERVPDLRSQLRVEDLRRAGWRVEGPSPTGEGGLRVQAGKRFANPREATRVVAELSGPEGPFRDFRLRQAHSFLKTRTEFRGTVDLQRGIESFADDELRRRVGGPAFGADPATLERQLGVVFSRIFSVQVAVRLPGEVDSNAPTEAGNGASWRPRLGERVVLEASAERWNVRRITAAAVAAVSAAALVGVLVRRVRRRSA